ncbi:OmpA family protein [Geomonas sp. Red32]|uniref:OmpA family protein n=1 Tax=Geomonas sp. Red32 TaxID=2912856 RepID=UPI00202CC1C1|nr:OmpA family protein [Geomonas sp. Red32]MCM0083519.1 OmpA family protein [Geomonas sp. Red32]
MSRNDGVRNAAQVAVLSERMVEAFSRAGAKATAVLHGMFPSRRRTGEFQPLPPMETVHFPTGAHAITEEARDIVARNAQLLRADPHLKVILIGHSDDRGSEERCLALGESFALEVHDHLLSLGIAPCRVAYVSRGKEEPVAHGRDPENRRVEFRPVR